MDASATGPSAITGLVRPSSIIVTTCFALAVAMAIFVTTRRAQLVRQRRAIRWPQTGSTVVQPQRPDSYYLFVLGSGGHTKEMLMMMDDGFCDFVGFHRRYLLSSGDRVSRHQLEDYETRLASLCRAAGTSPGTYDARTVARARRVHQSLLTTPLTALASVIGIFTVLLSPPARARRLRYPMLVFSNGPATGFCVAFAIHLLKVFCVVPEDVMRFVYIESWARISTLSLTGRLLLRSGFADALYVQHQELAAKYGLPCAGEMVLGSRRPDE
ncbi:hypothetical protein L249_3171 [Ophiocordyceps polyrhachis-furcata BCC 54312]|uniref:UDP-N-acetylglucosamine transferase subunit ALG14 n=1 Tax=Ophiocordyceps polyrhachis-furcata BCC 54312 TaxID=1330021 RepID=A0A367LSK4_9HYPO|nr:hypothetical protein L249_3171 [Ophiocordyceps polyrhachis-furcata BCC 54312]